VSADNARTLRTRQELAAGFERWHLEHLQIIPLCPALSGCVRYQLVDACQTAEADTRAQRSARESASDGDESLTTVSADEAGHERTRQDLVVGSERWHSGAITNSDLSGFVWVGPLSTHGCLSDCGGGHACATERSRSECLSDGGGGHAGTMSLRRETQAPRDACGRPPATTLPTT